MPKAATVKKEASDTTITLDARDFADRLQKIAPFMSTEVTRYYLNGIFMRYAAGKLTLVATNGYILQEQVFDIVDSGSPDFEVICPAFAVKTLPRLIGSPSPVADEDDEDESDDEDRGDVKYETSVSIKISGKNIRFVFSDWEFCVTAIDGKFPEYDRVIPEGSGGMNGFNSTYLKAVLAPFDGEGVEFRVNSEAPFGADPHLVVSSVSKGVKCVIMPMRVR